MNNTEKFCSQKIELPKGKFHSGYCSHYDTYYYPRERNGCLSRK